MITPEQIQERIVKLRLEQTSLQSSHDQMIRERNERETQFAQIVQANQNRFQQITGAIAQLTTLLNGEEPK